MEQSLISSVKGCDHVCILTVRLNRRAPKAIALQF